MELLIEACDSFVAVMDPITEGSTQLNIYLAYAITLRKARWLPRPRIFGVWLNGKPPRPSPALEGLALEWLTREDYHLLLEDRFDRSY